MTDQLEDTPGAGRPTDYRPEFCDTAKTLAMHGATDIEIADALGIHVSTYYRWRATHPDFREAVKLGFGFRAAATLPGRMLSPTSKRASPF
jgi:hypothetical protein